MKHSIVAALIVAAIWAGILPAVSTDNALVGTWQSWTPRRPAAHTATLRPDIFNILPVMTFDVSQFTRSLRGQ